MCAICERGITFEPGDLVVREFKSRALDWDKNIEYWYDGMQMGKVLAVSSEYGTVQVQWGIKEDEETETEWCWPSDFVARIRNGKYETIVELWGNPS